ncbi:phage portal protein, HK97 family [Parasphingorhabdus marina DSM 22363]|uniref:Phage portal protein, HK97 family n=1 Tax=Parasphingorhabdus marina DSM 22363 TaxID=1123272 RepID=A0A1N6CMN6_9SPHN|nr:phage portal protein [Parasphingorhabdus marina]SIN59634.1 phage portal protein, HK97 family [Parasphingorhabdus marina DSM 22363]
MTFWKNFALAFKGGSGRSRPSLGRSYIGTYGGAFFSGTAPFSYEASVREAYVENAVAQRAVRIVSEAVADAPLMPLQDKAAALIGQSVAGQPLLETITAHLLLHGNAYVQIAGVAEEVGRNNPPELYALRPDRITVEPDATGWPAAYVYRAGEHETRYPANDAAGPVQIVHIKAFHPTDDHYGLGCLGAAAGAVAVHNRASDWNRALLDNAARPSGALVHDPGPDGAHLSGEQVDRLRAEMEASFSGRDNAGRPLLLEGGLSWQALSMTPAEMDFVALKAAAAREIALAFGVPPMLLGLPGDNSYANYREANRALWRLTILPLAGKILEGLSRGLKPWWPDLDLRVDRDQIPALSEDRERMWNQISAADFLTGEEKRKLLGID